MLSAVRQLFKSAVLPDKKGFDQYRAGLPGKPNILVFTENVNATYFISFHIPFEALHQQGQLNFAVASQWRVGKRGTGIWERWNKEFRPTLVIMTRYGLPHGRKILEFFKAKKIPVVYHIDDNLLEIPSSLGSVVQKSQGTVEVVDERKYLLEHCDIIYVSTRFLAQHLQKQFPTQRIFTGMYAPYMANHIKKKISLFKKPLTIGYMGSRGHQEDLQIVVPSLVRLMNEKPNVRFEIFGTIAMPVELLQFGQRIKSHEVKNGYVAFLNILADLNWDIGLAPLADDKFNLCKAPTKYIEYSAAGTPVIASNVSVYNEVAPQNGIVLVQDDWYTAMKRLLESPRQRSSILKTAREFCAQQFSEEELQHQVVRLVGEACR